MFTIIIPPTEPGAEEFERKKAEWQEELDEMSEFLLIKSTEEQKEEGVQTPVDTAFIGSFFRRECYAA